MTSDLLPTNWLGSKLNKPEEPSADPARRASGTVSLPQKGGRTAREAAQMPGSHPAETRRLRSLPCLRPKVGAEGHLSILIH